MVSILAIDFGNFLGHLFKEISIAIADHKFDTLYPKHYSRPNAVRGEVILMHELLRETRGSVILYDEITSVYRFTGSGIWSSLTEDQQRQKNEVMNEALWKRRPLWLKLVMRFGVSKIAAQKCLN